MNLHEYQAKQLLAKFGLPVSKSEVVSNVEEALHVADVLGGKRWVVKAQVHAGGRGKAGGVKLVSSKEEPPRARWMEVLLVSVYSRRSGDAKDASSFNLARIGSPYFRA